MATTLDTLKKALKTLDDAIQQPQNEFLRDAVIQRFEYTIELAWRVAQKVMGSPSTAPKAIVREMASQGLITNPVKWIEYIDRRNETSHIYNQDVAKRVYDAAVAFAKDCHELIAKMDRP